MMLRLPLPAAAVLRWRYLAVLVLVSGLLLPAWYGTSHSSPNRASGQDAGRLRFDFDVAREAEADAQEQPEAYLQRIQFLLEASQYAQALEHAEKLVTAYPTFQLGNLLYADLLNLSTQAPETDPLGAIEAKNKPAIVQGLKKELDTRLRALRSPYPANTIPKGLGFLAPSTEHFAVVDASASRMYVFRNTPSPTAPVQLELLHHFYVSVGQNGIRKQQEGDGRTPLGVYFRLHGTPPAQFARAPRASDGCIVLANPDLERIIRTVAIRSTPVLIASSLNWVAPQQLVTTETRAFQDTLQAWRSARSAGDLQRLLSFYTPDMSYGGKDSAASQQLLKADLQRARGRDLELKDLSYLRWTDTQDTMVVTFGEVPLGAKTGPIKRQYWLRTGTEWKIFFEGVIG